MAMSPQTLRPKPSSSNAIKTHGGSRVLTHDSKPIGV